MDKPPRRAGRRYLPARSKEGKEVNRYTFRMQTGWTLFFSCLFWALGIVFICSFSDASWYVAFIGMLIGSIEVKVS